MPHDPALEDSSNKKPAHQKNVDQQPTSEGPQKTSTQAVFEFFQRSEQTTYWNDSIPVSELFYARSRHHQQSAVSLLEAYQKQDKATLNLFHQFFKIADNEKASYQPSLQDARVIVASKSNAIVRLNFEKIKKNAKLLLKDFKQGQSFAKAEFTQWHPKFASSAKDSVCLADAQLVIARRLGFLSWTELKGYLSGSGLGATWSGRDNLNRRNHTRSGNLDADMKTLHIRCGSDIKNTLNKLGFNGDYLEVSNPFVQGCVPLSEPLEHFVKTRDDFIKSTYFDELTDELASQEFTEKEERALRCLPDSYQRIVLWFEQDIYDQLCFAYVLHHMAKKNLVGVKLEVVQLEDFPGSGNFVSLGRLAHQQKEGLVFMWNRRRKIMDRDICFAVQLWHAYTSSNPESLHALTRKPDVPLPIMQKAILRVLREFPWVDNGLSLTERLALQIIAKDGPIKKQRIFHFLQNEGESMPFLGDVMFFWVLNYLERSAHPPLRTFENARGETLYALTSVGKALLDGDAHWLDLFPALRWVGSVSFETGKDNWCWDEKLAKLVLRRNNVA